MSIICIVIYTNFWLLIFFFQALDLKPNYVRAWANMGISYANQVCIYASFFVHIYGLSLYLLLMFWVFLISDIVATIVIV